MIKFSVFVKFYHLRRRIRAVGGRWNAQQVRRYKRHCNAERKASDREYERAKRRAAK